MHRSKPHVVLMQESWLKPDRQTDIDINMCGYPIYRNDLIESEHGGIATYVRQDLCA